ncbi:MAG TPA: hypothetical protein QF564_03150, partial [Pirellulaceae bacterium]|nr:hypothetical protein [Pirellulaceae bacterium]
LDGKEIGRGPIHHSESLVQTIRHRPLPLRIGYVRVGPDEYTTFQPKTRNCFLDGTIHEFRIERTTK